MTKSRLGILGFALCAIAIMASGPRASAQGTIADSSGAFEVGINELGGLFDGNTGVGFRRVADGFDPLLPGTPRAAWGVSANGTSGYVDPYYYGVSNIVLNTSSFGANSASVSAFLNDGTQNLLMIDRSFSFSAANILQIAVTVTNVTTAGPLDVNFSELVDWDLGTQPFFPFNEIITNSGFDSPVLDASFFGFESPDPLTPFFASSGSSGGEFGPGDLGNGVQISLGSIEAGGSVTFFIYHAITDFGQSEADLRALLGGTGGATDSVWAAGMAVSFGNGSAYVGSGRNGPEIIIRVPEPSSVMLMGFGLVGLAGYGLRRRSIKK